MGNFKKIDMLQKTVHCNAYKKQFFFALSCYVHKKKLKYKLHQYVINIQTFLKLISLNELITNFLKSRVSHKRNALSLKEQSRPLDGVTSAVQKSSMCVDRSFQYWQYNVFGKSRG